jgi:hypothetical protein
MDVPELFLILVETLIMPTIQTSRKHSVPMPEIASD